MPAWWQLKSISSSTIKSGFLCVVLCSAVAPAIADEFDKGAVAYKEGRYETAASIFEKLAEKGDHRAMSIIGSMYAAGLGISLDPKKAFVWLKEAAKHNRPDAEYRLGLMYDHGIGVKQNNRKAIRWYQKAVQHGYVPAQAMMGLKYARGDGFKRNKVKAYAWLSLSIHYFTDKDVDLSDAENAVPLEDRQDVVTVFESSGQRTDRRRKGNSGGARSRNRSEKRHHVRRLTDRAIAGYWQRREVRSRMPEMGGVLQRRSARRLYMPPALRGVR